MKINLNVFPRQYQCEPRDYKAIFFMVLSIIICIVIISVVFFFKNYRYNSKKSQSLEPIRILEDKKRSLELQKSKLQSEINTQIFSEAQKKELNERIRNFNKIKRNFYWGMFYQKLEEVVPDRIWVKNIIFEDDNMKKQRTEDMITNVKQRSNGVINQGYEKSLRESVNRKVYLSCEAADMFKPIEFVKNLELNPFFMNITMGRAEEDDLSRAVKFTMEFEINEKLFKKDER